MEDQSDEEMVIEEENNNEMEDIEGLFFVYRLA
jgi:hypothetical protein